MHPSLVEAGRSSLTSSTVGRIRSAIELDAKDPKRILTVRGVGYVFAKQQD